MHKVERICNDYLVWRYLHERSMIMLMNGRGGSKLDEAIPNPLLKVHARRSSEVSTFSLQTPPCKNIYYFL